MVSLGDIVRSYDAEEHRDTPAAFARHLRFAVDTLKDLHFTVNGQPNRVVIHRNSSGIFDLPEDFVKEVEVRVVDGHGRLVLLGRNENFGAVGGFYDDGWWSNNGASHFRNGEFIGAWYGVGGGTKAGDFSINYEEKTITVCHSSGNTIHLVYMASPKMINKDYMVHEFLVDAIMAGIELRDKRRFVGVGAAKQLMDMYLIHKTKAIRMFNSRSAEELANAIRNNNISAPRQ